MSEIQAIIGQLKQQSVDRLPKILPQLSQQLLKSLNRKDLYKGLANMLSLPQNSKHIDRKRENEMIKVIMLFRDNILEAQYLSYVLCSMFVVPKITAILRLSQHHTQLFKVASEFISWCGSNMRFVEYSGLPILSTFAIALEQYPDLKTLRFYEFFRMGQKYILKENQENMKLFYKKQQELLRNMVAAITIEAIQGDKEALKELQLAISTSDTHCIRAAFAVICQKQLENGTNFKRLLQIITKIALMCEIQSNLLIRDQVLPCLVKFLFPVVNKRAQDLLDSSNLNQKLLMKHFTQWSNVAQYLGISCQPYKTLQQVYFSYYYLEEQLKCPKLNIKDQFELQNKAKRSFLKQNYSQFVQSLNKLQILKFSPVVYNKLWSARKSSLPQIQVKDQRHLPTIEEKTVKQLPITSEQAIDATMRKQTQRTALGDKNSIANEEQGGNQFSIIVKNFDKVSHFNKEPSNKISLGSQSGQSIKEKTALIEKVKQSSAKEGKNIGKQIEKETNKRSQLQKEQKDERKRLKQNEMQENSGNLQNKEFMITDQPSFGERKYAKLGSEIKKKRISLGHNWNSLKEFGELENPGASKLFVNESKMSQEWKNAAGESKLVQGSSRLSEKDKAAEDRSKLIQIQSKRRDPAGDSKINAIDMEKTVSDESKLIQIQSKIDKLLIDQIKPAKAIKISNQSNLSPVGENAAQDLSQDIDSVIDATFGENSKKDSKKLILYSSIKKPSEKKEEFPNEHKSQLVMASNMSQSTLRSTGNAQLEETFGPAKDVGFSVNQLPNAFSPHSSEYQTLELQQKGIPLSESEISSIGDSKHQLDFQKDKTALDQKIFPKSKYTLQGTNDQLETSQIFKDSYQFSIDLEAPEYGLIGSNQPSQISKPTFGFCKKQPKPIETSNHPEKKVVKHSKELFAKVCLDTPQAGLLAKNSETSALQIKNFKPQFRKSPRFKITEPKFQAYQNDNLKQLLGPEVINGLCKTNSSKNQNKSSISSCKNSQQNSKKKFLNCKSNTNLKQIRNSPQKQAQNPKTKFSLKKAQHPSSKRIGN